MSLCGKRCARKKADKTVVVPSNTIAQRVKHFLAEMEKEDLIFLTEEQILYFLKMSQAERDAYAARGEMQKSVVSHFCIIENKMTTIESQERNTGKTSKVLRLLSNSGGSQISIQQENHVKPKADKLQLPSKPKAVMESENKVKPKKEGLKRKSTYVL